MRVMLPFCAIALASCTGEPVTFTVADPHGLAASGVLQLDGHAQTLARDGERLSIARIIRRDAHGRILITYADGRKVDCLIGYVTPSAPQRWEFRLTPSECERL